MTFLTRRSLHQAVIKLMLLSLVSSTLAGLIPPPLVRSMAPKLADRFPQPAVALAAGTISGTVFRDFNSDGSKSTGTVTDTGVAGVTVTLYDAAGTPSGSDVTDAAGIYSISATGTGPYRVEFTTLPTGYYPTFHASNSGSNSTVPNSTATTAGTTVQFVPDGGASNVNLGINAPEDYSQSNPRLAIAIHTAGAITPTNTLTPALYSFTYGAPQTGDGTGIPNRLQSGSGVEDPTTDAMQGQIGATWGLGYDRQHQRLFASAVLKRQVGLGPLGLGGIYAVDYSSGSATYAGSFNLQGVTPTNGGSAIDLGAVTRVIVTGTNPTAVDNGLNNDPVNPSKDIDAFAKVGKVGFGDLDVDTTRGILWGVNLNQRALISIDVRNYTPATNGPVPGTVNQYLLSSLSGVPTCSNGVFRPWALKFYRGLGYLGGVCTAENAASSGDYGATNISFHVLAFDPTNPTAGFTSVATAANYNRAEDGSLFYKWCDDVQANATQTACNYQQNGSAFRNVPQPLFTDLEFREDGSLIGGIADRYTMQQMTRNYDARTGTGSLLSTKSNGDIIFWCKVGNSYVAEGSAGCTVSDPASAPDAKLTANPPTWLTTDGLSGTGEFFHSDWFINNPSATLLQPVAHNETATGGLVVLPGSQQLLSTSYDPVSFVDADPGGGFGTQGVRWFNGQTGVLSTAYQLMDYPFNTFNTPPQFAKGNGLGDLELLADPAPIEIGNRVWNDADRDGIQDPNEAPISGVIVELYKNGVKVGQATTDAAGEYYFTSGTNSTDSNTNDNIIHDSGVGIISGTGTVGGNSLYEIRIPNISGGSKQAALGTNTLTPANAGGNDSIDSDGAVSGVNASYILPYADLAGMGYNSHTYDFGFGPPGPGTIQIIKNSSGGDGAFGFTSSNATLDAIHLTTVGGTASSAVLTFTAGNYTLREDALVGWSLTNLTCTGDSDSGTVVTIASRQVTIDLDNGENIVCTFTNTAQSGSVTPSGVLTLTKTVVGSSHSGPYSVQVSGPNSYVTNTTVVSGTPKVLTGLTQGVYTVTETSPGAGWVTTYTVNSLSNMTRGVVTLTNSSPIAAFGAVPVSGRVYRDFNSDGQITANGVVTDTGVANLTVTAYGVTGTACGSATSNSTGNYSFTPTCAGPWRLVFSDLPAGYEPAMHGSSNGTNVQFVSTAAAASNVNLGVLYPSDYCQGNPYLAVSCLKNGSGVGNSAAGYLSFALNSSGNSSLPTTLAQVQQVGSVWGNAFQRQSKTLFAAAFLKRHVGFGPTGVGGVYLLRMNPSTGAGTLLGSFDLQGVIPSNSVTAIDLGAVTRTNVTSLSAGAAGDNQLASNATAPNRDLDGYSKVGTVSYGDIDLSDDGNTLWLVNLHQKALLAVDITDLTQLPTNGTDAPAGLVKSYPIAGTGVPSCGTDNLRPWGLKIRQGRGYLGVVCDAFTTQAAANLMGYVLSFDLNNPTSFTQEVAIPFTYSREPVSISGPEWTAGAWATYFNGAATWFPWTNTWLQAKPQPLISDIEFDTNGNMTLGVMDRLANQGGHDNYQAVSGSVITTSVTSAGDILRVCKTGNGWVVECGASDSNTGLTPITDDGALSTDGPGGAGEFYSNDYFYNHPHQFLEVFHWEIATGALVYNPLANEMATTVFDPITVVPRGTGTDALFRTQGVHWYSAASGAKNRAYELVSSAPTADPTTFGKAAGLGDLELLCDAAPLEIGNRVWNDLDGDGVQYPGEPGLSGITVSLRGPTNTVTTNTDADGLYYFNNLRQYTAYTLTVDVPAGYSLSAANQAALSGGTAVNNHAVSDTIDSDAALVGGVATIYYSTGSAGQNNHGLDFGFTQPVSGRVEIVNTAPLLLSYTVRKTLATPDPVRVGDDITFTIRLTNTGSTPITTLPLRDLYNTTELLFLAATPPPNDNVNDGQLDWSDLTVSFGQDLAPGQSLAVTTVFVARSDTTFLPDGATVNTAQVLITPTQTVTAPVRIEAPTTVTLANASVRYLLNQGVTLTWATASEAEIVGFHLLRREVGSATSWLRLNSELLPAQQAGQASGASYTFSDPNVQFGHTYLYLLEVVANSGATSRRELGLTVAGSRVLLPLVTR